MIAAAIGLFEFGDLRRIYRIQRWEFWLSIVCFVGVAVFGVIPGIGIADRRRASSSSCGTAGARTTRCSGGSTVGGYHDMKRYPEARRIPGLVLFRWDAPLFFANAEMFPSVVLDAVAQSPTPVRRVVVTAEPITSVDVTSADMLAELAQQCCADRHRVVLRGDEGPGEGQAEALRTVRALRRGSFYPTIGAAVDAYLEEHAVDWSRLKSTPCVKHEWCRTARRGHRVAATLVDSWCRGASPARPTIGREAHPAAGYHP